MCWHVIDSYFQEKVCMMRLSILNIILCLGSCEAAAWFLQWIYWNICSANRQWSAGYNSRLLCPTSYQWSWRISMKSSYVYKSFGFKFPISEKNDHHIWTNLLVEACSPRRGLRFSNSRYFHYRTCSLLYLNHFLNRMASKGPWCQMTPVCVG